MSIFELSEATLILHVLIGGASATHALLYKRDPRAALGWIALCLLLPFIGALLYFLFGINRVKKRAQKLLRRKRGEHLKTTTQALDGLAFSKIDTTDIDLQRFTRVSDRVCSHALSAHNSVSVLYNGEQAYTAMLAAIRNAQQRIYLMTYIFQPDSIGKEFIQALGEAKERGVEVKIILDSISDWYSLPRSSRRLKKLGLDVVNFRALSWYPPSIGINLRNHKKLLLVDDSYAFLGGMNITDINCLNDPKNKTPTQDIQFQITGPLLEQCYALFAEVWSFVRNEELSLPSIPVNKIPAGKAICRALVDGPDESIDKIELMLIAAMNHAQRSVCIMTPYFLPSQELISAMNTAALRDVKVQVIIPERSDNHIADWACRNLLWELLERGVEVYAQTEPFNHAKLFIVDEHYLMLGSANIDTRSLRLNYELMLEVLDIELANELAGYCQEKIEQAHQFSLSEVDGRGFWIRLRDSLSWLFLPYL